MRINYALHDNSVYQAAQDGRAFAETIERILDKVDLSETLVVVTVDHSHGVVLSGVCTLSSDIMGFCKDKSGLNKKDANGKPFTTISFSTVSDDVVYKERPRLTGSQVKNKKYKQASLIPKKIGTAFRRRCCYLCYRVLVAFTNRYYRAKLYSFSYAVCCLT